VVIWKVGFKKNRKKKKFKAKKQISAKTVVFPFKKY